MILNAKKLQCKIKIIHIESKIKSTTYYLFSIIHITANFALSLRSKPGTWLIFKYFERQFVFQSVRQLVTDVKT